MATIGAGPGRQVFGYAFITNQQGWPLMVNRPTGELELPGGVTALEEPALRPAGYHLRCLGLDKRPGPILLVDHMEAIPLGATGDRLAFIFHFGELTPTDTTAIGQHGLPDDVTGWRFVDPRFFQVGITSYHRRILDAAVTAATTGIGAPYLYNARRVTEAAA